MGDHSSTATSSSPACHRLSNLCFDRLTILPSRRIRLQLPSFTGRPPLQTKAAVSISAVIVVSLEMPPNR